MAEARFYVYVHRQADTGKVFYVGKGSGKRAWSKQFRPTFWHRVKNAHGLIVEEVAYFWDESAAFDYERALIAECKAHGLRLTNCTDGGEGPSGAVRSEETRRRMSESGKGKRLGQKRSQETREQMRASALGRRMSPEAVTKTVAFHTGRKRGPETLAKMSAALKGKNVGRKFSEETLALLAELATGRKHTDETRAKMSAKAKGSKKRPQSPEHRAKIAEARRRYWAEWREKKSAAA